MKRLCNCEDGCNTNTVMVDNLCQGFFLHLMLLCVNNSDLNVVLQLMNEILYLIKIITNKK